MVLSVADAIDRLSKRGSALMAERARLIKSNETELARVDEQIAALNSVRVILDDKAQARVLDTMLAALNKAAIDVRFAGQ